MTSPRLVASHSPLIGIAGWKNSGKTTLVTRLVTEISGRGLRVATIKHAHHSFQIDDGETDSARHRRAGASQVAIVSPSRWAVVRELGDLAEPKLEEIIARLEPCDLIIVEGYKRAPFPKIEVRRTASLDKGHLSDGDQYIIAIAADHPIPDAVLPVFDLDAIARIADFILGRVTA